MVDLPTVQNVLASWWFNYDQANFESWEACFTGDARFSCRSDSGHSPVEDFLRADIQGRDEILAWNKTHRRLSPFPLRHNSTDVHLTAVRAGEAGGTEEADYCSYLFVTVVAGGRVVNAASGLCLGTVRIEDGAARIADMRVVLDFTDSRPLAEMEVQAVSPASR
jgi:SnoaL-like domain